MGCSNWCRGELLDFLLAHCPSYWFLTVGRVWVLNRRARWLHLVCYSSNSIIEWRIWVRDVLINQRCHAAIVHIRRGGELWGDRKEVLLTNLHPNIVLLDADYSGKMLLFRYWSFKSTDTTTLNRRVSLILPTRQLEQPEILLTHRFTLHSIFQRLRGTIMKTTTIHQIHSRNRSRSRGMHKKRDHLTKSEQAWTITSTWYSFVQQKGDPSVSDDFSLLQWKGVQLQQHRQFSVQMWHPQ